MHKCKSGAACIYACNFSTHQCMTQHRQPWTSVPLSISDKITDKSVPIFLENILNIQSSNARYCFNTILSISHGIIFSKIICPWPSDFGLDHIHMPCSLDSNMLKWCNLNCLQGTYVSVACHQRIRMWQLPYTLVWTKVVHMFDVLTGQ